MCFEAHGKAGGESKKRKNSVLGSHSPSAQDKRTSQKCVAKGYLLHGMSAIPAKSSVQDVEKDIVNNFRVSRLAERFVNERKKNGPTV